MIVSPTPGKYRAGIDQYLKAPVHVVSRVNDL